MRVQPEGWPITHPKPAEVSMDRERLCFDASVLRAFQFLEDRHDFRVVECGPTRVQYRREQFVVNVYHGRILYALGVEMSHPELDEGPAYEFADILGSIPGAGRGCAVPPMQPHTREKVAACVERLALQVREHCGALLEEDREAWKRLAQYRTNYSDPRADFVYGNTRRDAEQAWQEKDYVRVMRLYHPMREFLTAKELRRFAYARKKAGLLTRVWLASRNLFRSS